MSKQSTKLKKINLKVAKGLRLRIAEDGNTYGSISSSSGEFYLAPEVLTILTLLANFKHPVTVEVLPKLLKTTYQNILSNLPSEEECSLLIEDLLGAGVLVSDNTQSQKHLQNDGFGDPWAQWTMLADAPRCEAYFAALNKVIQKDSIVLDVGSGTGLLSAIALYANAKKVIAIEETNSAKYIQPILNKLELKTEKNKFTLHNKNSFDVTLNEKISVVVSELFGNDPFQEGVLSTLREIASKLEIQNVKFIPEKLTVYAQIVDLKHHAALNRIQKFQSLESNANSFLSDFLNSALNVLDLDDISFSLPLTKSDFKLSSDPVELGTTTLNPPPVFNEKSNPFKGKKTLFIKNSCSTAVCLLWFRVQIYQDITISSLISESDACDHWSPIIIPLKNTVSKDTELTIEYGLNEAENSLTCNIFQNKKRIGSR